MDRDALHRGYSESVHPYGPDESNPSGHSNYSAQNSVKLEPPPGTKQMWMKLTIDIDKVTEFKFPPGVTNIEFGYIPIETPDIFQPVPFMAWATEAVADKTDYGNVSQMKVSTHVNGSSRPEGDAACSHRDGDEKSLIERNDDTMAGCGSTWDRMCSDCGKIWRDDE